MFARQIGPEENVGTVVAIAGGPGVSGDYLRVLERLATDKFSVVTYDQRATGKSSIPLAQDAFLIERYVHDLEVVRHWTEAEQIHVVGHSWGGVLAMAYAGTYPEHVASVVLVGSGAPTREGQHRANTAIYARKKQIEQALTIHTPPDSLAPECLDWWPYFVAYYANPDRLRAEHLPTSCHPNVTSATWSALGDYNFTPGLKQVSAPFLLLYGDTDPLLTTRLEIENSLLSEPQTHILSDCGHRPMFECPDQFFPLLVAFLQANSHSRD
ncbi:MAG: alpha/beta fold hydrolase [Proteobacteria bacterium]|nr:alpha/beta fold hydrolase [Pseudomonadota bacterium]